MKLERPLSYSAWSMYMSCPKKYQLHYIDKIRPIQTGSALVFGRAVDVAINDLLAGKPEFEAMEAGCQILDELKTKPTKFDSRDFDSDLLSEETKEDLLKLAQSHGYSGDDYDYLIHALMDMHLENEEMSENQVLDLAEGCCASLQMKLGMILDTFQRELLPNVTNVKAVQKNVHRGIVDFEATLNGVELDAIDNKTSSKPYPKDAVEWSVQLAAYGASKAGYIVFDKNIQKNRVKTCRTCGKESIGSHKTCDATINQKRCHGEWIVKIRPEVKFQVLVNEVPSNFQKITEESFQETEKAISLEVFPRNLNSCRIVGRTGQVWPCDYAKFCREGNMAGLCRKESRSE